MFGVLNWTDLEIGKEYQYEEGWYLQLPRVKVLNVLIEERYDKSNEWENTYVTVTMEVLEKGYCEGEQINIGDILTYSRVDKGKGSYLGNKMLFKPIGNLFDYQTPFNNLF